MGGSGFRPTVIEPFPVEIAFAGIGAEPDLQRVVLVEVEVEFDLRRHLPQVNLHLMLEMRITAQERRQKMARGGDIDRAHAALQGQGHERTGRPFRQAIKAMLHADQLEFRPGMVRLRRKEEAHVFQRFTQARGGDDLEVKVESGGIGAAAVPRVGGGMKLRNDARAERAELDRRAVIPMAPAARAPLREPGEQAAIVVEKRTGDAVLVGEQDGEKIAQPAQQHLVVGVEEFRAVRRFVAEAADLEKIARAFLELRGIDAQVDLQARLERVEARLDFPHDAQFAPRMGLHLFRADGEPVEHFAAEGFGFLGALLLLEVGPVEVGLQ